VSFQTGIIRTNMVDLSLCGGLKVKCWQVALPVT
jgi:hypothetical protein